MPHTMPSFARARTVASALAVATSFSFFAHAPTYALEDARERESSNHLRQPPRSSDASRLRVDASTRTAWDDDWDGRAFEPPSTTTRVIWFVRHGQAIAEALGVDDATRALTPLGVAQASRSGARLRELLGNEEPKSITHSTMTRAKQTADIIAEYFPSHVARIGNELIREGAPCRPEPDTWKQKPSSHVDEAPRIEAGFRSICHRATNEHEDSARGDERIQKDATLPSMTHEIVVCHGNVIRYSALRAMQLPPDAWLRMSMYNASITRIDIRPDGGVSLRCAGDAGHLPANELTFN